MTDVIRGATIGLLMVVFGASCAPSNAPPPAGSQTTPQGDASISLVECFERARAAGADEDWIAMRDAYRQANTIEPDHPTVLFALARAEARAGDDDACRAHLEHYARLGATADLTADDVLGPRLETAGLAAVAERLLENAAPATPATLEHRFTDENLWPEGIAYDGATGDLYVGSIKRRAIYRVTRAAADSSWSAIELGSSSSDDLLEVLGVFVDDSRRELWACTGEGSDDAQHTGDPRRNELVRYDLTTGRLEGRFELPRDKHRLLNDVVVAADGTVYASESFHSEVYRLEPGGDLELYLELDQPYANGITLSDDDRTLYVADYAGLTAVDTASGEHERVRGEGIALGFADGLSYHDGGLLLVQNTPRLNMRLAWVALDQAGRRAESLTVLPSGLPDGLLPYTSAIGGGHVYAVASASFDLLDRGETPPAPVIVGTPLP